MLLCFFVAMIAFPAPATRPPGTAQRGHSERYHTITTKIHSSIVASPRRPRQHAVTRCHGCGVSCQSETVPFLGVPCVPSWLCQSDAVSCRNRPAQTGTPPHPEGWFVGWCGAGCKRCTGDTTQNPDYAIIFTTQRSSIVFAEMLSSPLDEVSKPRQCPRRAGGEPTPPEGHKMTELPGILVVIACTLAALVAIVFALGRMSLGWWPR